MKRNTMFRGFRRTVGALLAALFLVSGPLDLRHSGTAYAADMEDRCSVYRWKRVVTYNDMPTGAHRVMVMWRKDGVPESDNWGWRFVSWPDTHKGGDTLYSGSGPLGNGQSIYTVDHPAFPGSISSITTTSDTFYTFGHMGTPVFVSCPVKRYYRVWNYVYHTSNRVTQWRQVGYDSSHDFDCWMNYLGQEPTSSDSNSGGTFNWYLFIPLPGVVYISSPYPGIFSSRSMGWSYGDCSYRHGIEAYYTLDSNAYTVGNAFVLYFGDNETWSRVRDNGGKPVVVSKGQVYNVTDKVVLTESATLEIQKGAVMSVDGTLFNDGRIVNYGTIVLQEGACVQPFSRTSYAMPDIENYGTIIIMPGARLFTGQGNNSGSAGAFRCMQNSKVIVYGDVVSNQAYFENSRLELRDGGRFFTGAKVKNGLGALTDAALGDDLTQTQNVVFTMRSGNSLCSFNNSTVTSYGAGKFQHNAANGAKPMITSVD